jgi:hypothetical protein
MEHYTIHFEGWVVVQANNEDEAKQKVSAELDTVASDHEITDVIG